MKMSILVGGVAMPWLLRAGEGSGGAKTRRGEEEEEEESEKCK